MTSSEVIDVSFRMFQVLGWTFLRLSIGPVLFCIAALAFVNRYALPGLIESSSTNWEVQIREASVAIFLSLFVGGPLFLVGVASVNAAVTQLVSDFMVGNVPDERAAQAAMARSLSKLIVLSVRELLLSLSGAIFAVALLMLSSVISKTMQSLADLSGVVFAVALIAFVPGVAIFVYFRVVHALGPTVAVLENANAKQASKRSKYLVNTPDFQGSGQSTLISLFFLSAFILLVLNLGLGGIAGILGLQEQVQQAVANLPLPGLWMQAFDLIPLFLSLWIVLPLWATTTTVLYYDRRIRLEGYDIEALAGDVWRADQQSRFQL